MENLREFKQLFKIEKNKHGNEAARLGQPLKLSSLAHRINDPSKIHLT